MRCALAGAALTAGVFTARGASADHSIPRAAEIAFEPGNPRHVVLRSDSWGIFQSLDGGATWQFGCAELFGGRSQDLAWTRLVLAAGGRILVPNQNFVASRPVGLAVSDDFCDWRASPDLSGNFVVDIVSRGSDFFALVENGTDGGIVGQVYVSRNGGDTWQPVGGRLPTDFAGTSLAVAPSDPSRIYVLGEVIDTGGQTSLLESSDDAGATWTRNAGQIVNDSADWTPRIYGVHPTLPDVVFARADGFDLGTGGTDEVWATGDGGVTWRRIYAGAGDLPGFSFSEPDASQILVSGPLDGIEAATISDAFQGATSFSKIYEGQIWGLNWTINGLYAGGNDFTLNSAPTPFTFGVSHDGGQSFTSIMTVCDVTFPACGAASTVATECAPAWNEPWGYERSYPAGPRCPPEARTPSSLDAGAAPSSPRGADSGSLTSKTSARGIDGGGCACEVPQRPNERSGNAALMLVLAVAVGRRKRLAGLSAGVA